MVVDRTKIERLGEEPEEARSEEVNGMPDAGAEWRKERKSEIWERVELRLPYQYSAIWRS